MVCMRIGVIFSLFIFGMVQLSAGDFYSLDREFKLPMSRPEASLNQVISPDGRYIAFYETIKREELQANPQRGHFAPSLDIKIWDLQENKLKTTLVGHESQIVACTFSNDGKNLPPGIYQKWKKSSFTGTKLVSGDMSGVIKVWNLDQNTNEVFAQGENGLSALGFTAFDQDILIGIAFGQNGSAIKNMPLNRSDIGQIDKTHNGRITSFVAYLEDISTNISGATDGSIKVWSHSQVARGSLGTELQQREVSGVVSALSLSHNIGHHEFPDVLAVGRGNGKLELYSLSDDRRRLFSFIDDALTVVHENGIVASMAAHAGPIKAVTFSRDNRRIISGSHDKTIKVWNRESGKLIEVLEECSAPVIALVMTKDNHLVACCSDGTVKIFKDIAEQKEVELKREERERIEQAVLEDQKIRKRKKEEEEKMVLEVYMRQAYEAQFRDMSLSLPKKGNLPLALSRSFLGFSKEMQQWQKFYTQISGKSGNRQLDATMNDKIEQSVLGDNVIRGISLREVVELSDRELLLRSERDMFIYNRLTGKIVKRFERPGESFEGYGSNPLVKGNQLLTLFKGTVRIWDLATGKCMKTISDDENIDNFALSSKGDLVTFVHYRGFRKVVKWWNIEAGESIKEIRVTDSGALSLKKVLPSGDLLFSGYKGLYLVDQQTGNVIRNLHCDEEYVCSILILPNDIVVVALSNIFSQNQRTFIKSFNYQTGECLQLYEVSSYGSICYGSICRATS